MNGLLRRDGGGRYMLCGSADTEETWKLTCKYCSNPPRPFHRQYIPSVRYAACCKKIGGAVMVLSGGSVKTSIATF